MTATKPLTDVRESDVDVLLRLMTTRFTCRAYRPDPVPEETIRSIMDVARRTASWSNVQPWQIVICTQETTEAFRQALMKQEQDHPEVDSDIPYPPSFQGLYRQRRRETGYALYSVLGISKEDWDARKNQTFQNFRLFGAPHVAIVTTPKEIGTYGAVDCGAFVGSFLLAARAHGVDTTAQAALAHHCGFIRSYFGIADEQNILCGISFGYADENHPVNSFRTKRAPVDELMRLV